MPIPYCHNFLYSGKIMNDRIFKAVDFDNDPEWVVEEFFNSIYMQYKFLWVLSFLVKKVGCSVNETYCFFPDFSDPDPESHFEGVVFGVWGGEVVVPETLSFEYVQLACDKYVQLHPEDSECVVWILGGGDYKEGR